ncbi:MAG TPA: guanylate kinase [Actinomycetota bacterium]|jgi:guanylate kinase
MHPGRLFVIAGPSGVGKGTVIRRVLDRLPDLVLSVSSTTRAPRPGEIEGRDYRFVSTERFRSMVERGEFLEWADIYGSHRSGTPADPVREQTERGHDVVLEIDLQGAMQVRARWPGAVLIFLAPPSSDELARRLRERGTETPEQLERRLAAARTEMAQAGSFDHRVVNDDVERAAAEIAAIIAGERGSDPAATR